MPNCHSLDLDWTFDPIVPNDEYFTSNKSYQVIISTILTLNKHYNLFLDMICATSQPDDFSLSSLLVQKDTSSIHRIWADCPSVLGNISTQFFDLPSGTYPFKFLLDVSGSNNSEWLSISDINIVACTLPFDWISLWIVIGFMGGTSFLFLMAMVIMDCRKKYNIF